MLTLLKNQEEEITARRDTNAPVIPTRYPFLKSSLLPCPKKNGPITARNRKMTPRNITSNDDMFKNDDIFISI